MTELQQLEKTIGDLILTIESLQRDIIALKKSNDDLGGKLRIVSEHIENL